jgi:dihydrofolate reductase
MAELVVDFITSLDGFAAAEGWPGYWGLEGPEYLAWRGEAPEGDHTVLMGRKTYQLMYGFFSAARSGAEVRDEERATIDPLGHVQKVVFSSTLDAPLAWANSRLVRGDAAESVRAMKRDGVSMRTIGSLSVCRSLLTAGLVDRFRVAVFPVITGRTGRERIYDGYPDVKLDLINARTFDGRIQMLDYVPTPLASPLPPPGRATA